MNKNPWRLVPAALGTLMTIVLASILIHFVFGWINFFKFAGVLIAILGAFVSFFLLLQWWQDKALEWDRRHAVEECRARRQTVELTDIERNHAGGVATAVEAERYHAAIEADKEAERKAFLERQTEKNDADWR